MKLRNSLMSGAIGLGLHAEIVPNTAEADELPNIELLSHISQWGERRDAQDIAIALAQRHPYDFLRHTEEIAHGNYPWAETAFEFATKETSNGYRIEPMGFFHNLDVTDPAVFLFLENALPSIHGVVINYYLYITIPHTPEASTLFFDALLVGAMTEPNIILSRLEQKQDVFISMVPDVKDRERIMDELVVNAINESPESLSYVASLADTSSDMRKTISRAYGWEGFLDRCSERIPGKVYESLDRGYRTFIMLTFEKKRMEFYRHAALRAPGRFVKEYPLSSAQKILLTKQDEEEFERLVNDAYFSLVAYHLFDFHESYFDNEKIQKFPGIRLGLSYAAEHNPIAFLQAFHSQSAQGVQPYRDFAAKQVLTKRLWEGTSTNDIFWSLSQYSTLFYNTTHDSDIRQQQIRSFLHQSPDQVFTFLQEWHVAPSWALSLKTQAAIFALEQRSSVIDDVMIHSYNLGTGTLPFVLAARAQDDFLRAVDLSSALFLATQNDAYFYLYTLEQAQPYEYAKWIRDNEKSDNIALWKKSVTSEQWESLKAHAVHRETDIVSYKNTAESLVKKGFRFTPQIIEDVNGMNYHHRLTTTIDATEHKDAIAGKNFITIPMIAFEAIAISAPFETYIDSHADGSLTFINLCSMIQTTFRRLRDVELLVTDENIALAIHDIDTQWDTVKHTEIFGPNTKLIVGVGEEPRFSNQAIIDQLFIGHGGHEKNIIYSGKGAVQKQALLDAIGSVRSGFATIVLDGHGTDDGIYLDHTVFVTVQELANRIFASHNAPNLRFILEGCSGYDFTKNLLVDLRKQGVNMTGMIIITDANRDSLAFGGGDNDVDSDYLSAVNDYSPTTPITLETFRRAEHKVWLREDPSITIGLQYSAKTPIGIEVVDAQE